METIKMFENEERLVKLIFNEINNTYTSLILTHNGKSKSKGYKSKFYAERKFNDYKNYPLVALGVK